MFESLFSLAQVLGYVALLVSLLGYQVRSQRGLFAANIGSDVFWGLHYAALGGFMPVVAVAVSALRTTFAVFVLPHRKVAIAVTAFLVATAICIATNTDGPKGYLIIATALVYSICVVFHDSYAISRSLMALGLALWIAIGALYGSIGEIVSSAISLISLGVGVLRHIRTSSRSPISGWPNPAS